MSNQLVLTVRRAGIIVGLRFIIVLFIYGIVLMSFLLTIGITFFFMAILNMQSLLRPEGGLVFLAILTVCSIWVSALFLAVTYALSKKGLGVSFNRLWDTQYFEGGVEGQLP